MSLPVVSLSAPKGLAFVQYVKCLGAGADRFNGPLNFALKQYGEHSQVVKIIKAAIEAGSTLDGNWGEPSAIAKNAAAEFFTLVENVSIVGRLAGVRRVPLNVPLLSVASGSTAYWVSEGKAKPISKQQWEGSNLQSLKVAALAVLTKELFESQDPRSETVIRADLVRALTELMDYSFLDPTNAGVAETTPASILNGVSPVVSVTGGPADDIKALLAHFLGDLSNAFFIMCPFAATQLNSAENPFVGARGGNIAGVEVITSANVPDGIIALVDARAVAIADGPMDVRVSTQSTIEMQDAPTGDVVVPSAETDFVSLWQTNSRGIVVEKTVNWRIMRTGAVKFIENATWAIPVTET